jgi:hypothetical protein
MPPDQDCRLKYGEWSLCSASCGGGFRQRSGHIAVPQIGNGQPCAETEQTEQCNEIQCMPIW